MSTADCFKVQNCALLLHFSALTVSFNRRRERCSAGQFWIEFFCTLIERDFSLRAQWTNCREPKLNTCVINGLEYVPFSFFFRVVTR